jgi:membrane associated rhomboid family serine protease
MVLEIREIRRARSSTKDALRFSLFWLAMLCVVTMSLLALIAHDPNSVGLSARTVLITLLVPAIFLSWVVLLVVRNEWVVQVAGSLSLEPEGIRGQSARGLTSFLPYGQLGFAGIMGSGPGEHILLQGQQKGFMPIQVLTCALADPGLARPFVEEILDRVAALPEGREQREALEQRQAVAQQNAVPQSTSLPLKLLVKALIVLLLFAQGLVEALADPAPISTLTFESRGIFYWTVAALLHVEVLRALVCLSVADFSDEVETAFGRSRLLTLFFGSGLAGMAGSAWFGAQDLSIGASAGVLGLLGGWLVLYGRWRRPSQSPWTRSWRWNAILIFLLLLYWLGNDPLVHFGALLVGCLLMLPATRIPRLADVQGRNRRFYAAAAGLLGVLFVAFWTRLLLSLTG